jgi:hypothetical protein
VRDKSISSGLAFLPSLKIAGLMASASVLNMVEIAARRVRNTVISAKNNGPAPNTHNTDECCRYNPDGSRKQYKKGKSNGDKKAHNNFSQQLQAQQEKIDNLEKKLKRYDKKRSNEESDNEDMA